jgi:RNA polymerase sigma factor (sigma-70 family)
VSKNYLSDQELLAALKHRDAAALNYLYQTHWPMILRMVKINSGDQAEAEDLYQESILDFLEKVWNEDLVLTCKLKNFLYSICRRKWLYQLRGRPRFMDIEEYVELGDQLVSHEEESGPNDNQIKDAIQALGEPCQTLLFGYYYEKLTFEQLAFNLGYKSMYVARQQKFRCKERLKNAFSLNMLT